MLKVKYHKFHLSDAVKFPSSHVINCKLICLTHCFSLMRSIFTF